MNECLLIQILLDYKFCEGRSSILFNTEPLPSSTVLNTQLIDDYDQLNK